MPSPTFTAWGGVTDPEFHNPENYRYLAHIDTGFIDYANRTKRYFIDNIAEIDIPLGSGHKRSRSKRPVISASLIDHRVNPLFVNGSHGLVLEAPPEAVIATSAVDIWIDDGDLDRLAKEPPHDPEQLLELTFPFTNNEVILEPQLVVVRAILHLGIERYPHRHETHTFAQLKDAGQRYCLPVITI